MSRPAWIGRRRSRQTAVIAAAQPAAAPAEAAPSSAGMLDLLYEHSPMGLVLCDAQDRVLRANPAFLRISGHGADSLRGLPFSDLHRAGAAAAQMRETLERDGTCPPLETELVNRDGMRVAVQLSAKRIVDARGATQTWHMVEDLTFRRQMAEALRHSESEARMLSAVASHTRGLVVICDSAGLIEWANQAFEIRTGYSRREVLGKKPADVLHGPDTDPAAIELIRAHLAAHQGFNTEVLNYTRDGQAFWVALEVTPVFDHAGQLERIVSIARDITATRGMHRALVQSEERFRDLTELSSDFFWEQDAQFRFVEMTETGLTRGASQIRLGARPWENPFSLLDARAWARHREMLDAHQPFVDFENPVLTPDGCVVWRSISGKPRFDAEGRFLGYRGVGRDISARKEAEEYIQESKRMYRRVVEGVRDIIFQADAQGHFVFLNRAWTEATGFGVEEAMGAPLYDYMHEADREEARRVIGAAAAGAGQFLEGAGRILCRNGDYRWFEARVQSYVDTDGEFITVGTLHDVTRERAALDEQRSAEAALRAAQERYQRALNATNDGMWERDLHTDRVFYSARFRELLGLADDEFDDSRPRLHERLHPQDLQRFKAAQADMLARRSRSAVDCRIRCGPGDDYRWFSLRSTVTCDTLGTPLFTSGTLTDIHAAKLAEQELTRHRDDLAGLVDERTASAVAAQVEAELAREAAEAANHSKSEFLANMSHELRTPMHAILSFASFGVDKAASAERPKLKHYFDNIKKSGGHLLVLLNDLLDLSKLEAGKMEMHLKPVDPAQLLREALEEAEALARSRSLWIELRVPEQPLRAWLDTSRLLQVLRNLLSNAIKFSPPGGRVELTLAPAWMHREDGSAGAAGGNSGHPALEIRVGDEGVGIPEGELEAVFDKFVQSSKTKTGAGGTGLGLSICREIVLAHGGTIEARNNLAPRTGACFVVRLPADGGAARKPAPAQLSLPGADIPG